MNRRITAAVAVAILLTGSCKQPTADDENNTTAKTETMTVKDTDITPNGFCRPFKATMAEATSPTSTASRASTTSPCKLNPTSGSQRSRSARFSCA